MMPDTAATTVMEEARLDTQWPTLAPPALSGLAGRIVARPESRW